MVTGKYPHELDIWNNASKAKISNCFVNEIKDAGYHTAAIGKMHLSKYSNRVDKKHLNQLGFEYIDYTAGHWTMLNTSCDYTIHLEEKYEIFEQHYNNRRIDKYYDVSPSPLGDDHPDNYVGSGAVNYLEEYNFEKPLFLMVGFPGPHEPYDPVAPYDSIEFDDLPIPIDGPNGQHEHAVSMRQAYAQKIRMLDDWVGKIEAVCPENTIIVITSDHGDMLGDHGRLAKMCFFDSAVHVPFVIRGPGIDPQIKEDLIELVDIFPIVMEAAGIKSQPMQKRDAVLSEYITGFMLRYKGWKYIVSTNGEEQIFNLIDDPHEQNNLANPTLLPLARSELFKRMMSIFHPGHLKFK